MFRYTFGIELNSIKDSLHKVENMLDISHHICFLPSTAVTILQRCRVKHHQRRV